MEEKRKGLAISGGGALGAYAGGVLQHLISDMNKEYDIIVGTSTGSLMAPLAALGEIDLLKEAYTSVTNEDIFNVNPFKQDEEGANTRDIKLLNALWRIARGKKSLGETEALRKTMEKFVSAPLYAQLQDSHKQVIVTVANLNTHRAEYKANYGYGRNDFLDWMWASACIPIFMSTVEKDGSDYVDGGIVDYNPIQILIDRSCVEIDAIMLRTSLDESPGRSDNKGVLDVIKNVIGTLTHEIVEDDVEIADLEAYKYDVDIDYYYTPHKLGNSMNFDKKQMNKWWELGYEIAKDREPVHKKILKKPL